MGEVAAQLHHRVGEFSFEFGPDLPVAHFTPTAIPLATDRQYRRIERMQVILGRSGGECWS
ncbi:hypothetical protein GCM10011591_27240 [Nocardia camponoti]|uniref:Uncharacterized protein n=1 Tax=Nocardia camponoti TaxID=1616106 RepID=A0A917QJS5_9NOCA|nr:hypothetical protein GCM10011591_27240 [Nocardia camponoti]